MEMTLRTDDELERALDALAEAEGLSRQEVIRQAVLERYERAGHRARVDESVQLLEALTRLTGGWRDRRSATGASEARESTE